MRNRKLLIVFASVGLLGWTLFLGKDRHDSREDEIEPRAESQGRETVPKGNPSFSPRGLGTVSDFENHLALRQAAREQALNEWRTPIEFYGKVIDEKGAPVAQAQVGFGVTDLSQEGHSTYQTVSDDEGRFSLGGIKGKLLTVTIHKDGYEVSKQNTNHFFYAGSHHDFKPDIENRVVFRLYKKKPADRLIRSVFPTFAQRFQLKPTGEPASFDLLEGKHVSSGQGQIQVVFVAEGRGRDVKKFDWKLILEVPRGGLCPSTKEFDYIASESGYEKTSVIEMAASDENWASQIERAYFLKLENGMYGRIIFRLLAHNGVFRFKSFVNPSGSTNLEFDPAVQR